MAYGEHKYRVSVQWTGNKGNGTSGYRSYARDHVIRAGTKPDIPGSSDAAFLGDAARWNPEDLLLASASACHKLWYLHLCADAGVCVLAYADEAEGTMIDSPEQGRFTEIVLHPGSSFAPEMIESWPPTYTIKLMRNATWRIPSISPFAASRPLSLQLPSG